jgi:UDP-3-O-acyl N-acetylglucosamine deacetylase
LTPAHREDYLTGVCGSFATWPFGPKPIRRPSGRLFDPVSALVAFSLSQTAIDRAFSAVKQTTLRNAATITGITLHTGARVQLTLCPAPAGTGIRFCRTDLRGSPEIPARVENVVDVRRATTIGCGEARVHTVEHVLAALHAFGVDNARVEMTGPEPPVVDGSARAFVQLIRRAGIVELDADQSFFEVPRLTYLEMGQTRMIAVPDPALRISCTVKFGACVLDSQYLTLEVGPESFEQELAAARTFCLYEEIQALMAANLILGGSLDNAVVIKDGAILSKDGLRYGDELVRHKMLDLVGDLYLLGRRVHGHFIVVRPGHQSNVALNRLLVESLGRDCAA